jgi:hypothetical protein
MDALKQTTTLEAWMLEDEDEEKGCVKCGSAPRHNQTDEDGSYLCLFCEQEQEDEEEEDEEEQEPS